MVKFTPFCNFVTFRFVRKWAEQQSGSTEQQNFEDILPHIRFPLMTPSEIREFVEPARLLSQPTLSALTNYFEADIETKFVNLLFYKVSECFIKRIQLYRKTLARTLLFDTRRRKSPDSIASVSLYEGDLTNRPNSWEQFQELKECLQ